MLSSSSFSKWKPKSLETMTNSFRELCFRFPLKLKWEINGKNRVCVCCTFKAFCFLSFEIRGLRCSQRWQRRVWVETRGFWQVLSFTHILENLDMKRAWDNLWASTLSLMRRTKHKERTEQMKKKVFGHNVWMLPRYVDQRCLILKPIENWVGRIQSRSLPFANVNKQKFM